MLINKLQIFKAIKTFNALLWALLGILIVVWLFEPNKVLELVIWIGFAVGCILIGILELITIYNIIQ